jgi:hypothetical protein
LRLAFGIQRLQRGIVDGRLYCAHPTMDSAFNLTSSF